MRQNNSCLPLIAAKDKGEKKLFVLLTLDADDGTTLSDDIHELYVYKVMSLGLSPSASDHCHMWFSVRRFPEWASGSRVGAGGDSRAPVGRLLSFPHRSHQQGLCFQLPTPLVVEIYYSAPLCHYSLGSYV